MSKYTLNNFKPRPTEFEIQATAYHKLKEYYPIVKGELKINGLFKGNRKHGIRSDRGARFDLVVFNSNGDMLFTIEVKDNPAIKQHSKKQFYESIVGVPNILIAGMEQANNAVDICRSTFKDL